MTRTARVAIALAAVPFVLSSSACGEHGDDAHPRRDAGPAAAPPRPHEARLFDRSRPLMGTVFKISVAGETDDTAEPAVRAAFEEIARLETVLSEWLPDSEISRVNAQAGIAPVEVGTDTMAVVRAGVEVSRWSNGAFDLTWAALRGLYLFQPDSHRVPTREEIRARLPLIDWQDIVIDEARSTVFLERHGMAIGTGGIAKGYALDRAGAVLQRYGIENYMLFGGGQVTVRGRRGERAWRVGIQHPRRDDYFGYLEASDGSISTSGDYEHFFIEDGRRWHHIIDTRTGYPATRSVSVTLLAQSGIYADALSTAVFVLGPERGLAMLARIPMRTEAVIVDPELHVATTPGTRERLVLRVQLDHDRLPP